MILFFYMVTFEFVSNIRKRYPMQAQDIRFDVENIDRMPEFVIQFASVLLLNI